MFARNYPHLRGEELEPPYFLGTTWELPPLTRGRARIILIEVAFPGITPAYAGKSCWLAFASLACWNYPRLRGEEIDYMAYRVVSVELPPLTRGRDNITTLTRAVRGITPAYAGKSLLRFEIYRLSQNYPRLRGEELLVSFC